MSLNQYNMELDHGLPIPNHNFQHGVKAKVGSVMAKVAKQPYSQQNMYFYSENPQYTRINRDTRSASYKNQGPQPQSKNFLIKGPTDEELRRSYMKLQRAHESI